MDEYMIIDNKKCKILHYFKRDNDNYIIYHDGTLNDDNELEIHANKFKIENNKLILLPINDNEWNIIDDEWKKENE